MTGASGFDDHGPRLMLGSVFGVRQWSRQTDGGLQGVHSMVWNDGENIATCTREHPVPFSMNAQKLKDLEKRRDALHTEWQRIQAGYSLGLAAMPGDVREHHDKVYDEWVQIQRGITSGSMVDCGCGFWSYWQFDPNEFHMGEKPVVGVVEGYGRCIIGKRGFRSEKARIVALHCAYEYVRPKPRAASEAGAPGPGWHSVFTSDYESGTAEAIARLAADEEELAARYPSARVYSTLDAMLKSHPPTTDYL